MPDITVGQRYRIDYDEEADILYVSFGKPKKAVGIEMGDGNVIRVDPFDKSVTGVTIIDFSHRYGAQFRQNIEETTRIIVPEILNEFKIRILQRPKANPPCTIVWKEVKDE